MLYFWHSSYTLPLAFKRSLWMPFAHYHQRELFLVYDHHRRHPEQFIIYKSFNVCAKYAPFGHFLDYDIDQSRNIIIGHY